MRVVARWLAAMVLCALAAACQNPIGPASTGYSGQWSGTTAQGASMAFTISPEETVTTLSIGHDFNGCSGSQTFSNLSLSIAPQIVCIGGPCPVSLTSYRAFGYLSGNPIEGPSTSVNAMFTSPARAEGRVNLLDFPGCGSALGVPWTATRR